MDLAIKILDGVDLRPGWVLLPPCSSILGHSVSAPLSCPTPLPHSPAPLPCSTCALPFVSPFSSTLHLGGAQVPPPPSLTPCLFIGTATLSTRVQLCEPTTHPTLAGSQMSPDHHPGQV